MSETNCGNWKPFKNDKNAFYFTLKALFVFKIFKVGPSPSKKICVVCFIESPLKMMKNVFNFTLKALFILKICKFMFWILGHIETTAWLEK